MCCLPQLGDGIVLTSLLLPNIARGGMCREFVAYNMLHYVGVMSDGQCIAEADLGKPG